MAHQGQPTHRRMLSHSDRHPQPPSPSVDHHHHRSSHRQPSKSKPKPIHPVPDPPPTTIQSISHRFSKLYANHKKQIVSKPSQDSSQCTALTKSSSHHERNHHTHAEFKPKPHLERRECAKNLIPKTLEIEDEGPELKKGISQVQLGARRKSFCSSQSELADFLFCSGVKVVAVDMPPFMQIHAVDCARKTLDSLEKFTSKTLAFTLKKEFDGVYGPAWHCIVGTSFGSFVTHSVGGFMYFSVDQKLYVLLFKTTVQRADQ